MRLEYGLAFLSGGPIGRSQTDKNCTASPRSTLTAIYCQMYAQVRKNPEQVTVETGRRSRPSRSRLGVRGHTESTGEIPRYNIGNDHTPVKIALWNVNGASSKEEEEMP